MEEVGVWALNCKRLRSGIGLWLADGEREGEGDASGEEFRGRNVWCKGYRDIGVDGLGDIYCCRALSVEARVKGQ